jgi:hypothetical protein
MSQSDVGRYLALSGGATAKARGVHEIISVAQAGTSCVIAKGSDHASTGSVTWAVMGSRGGSSSRITGIYFESGDSSGAWAILGPDEVSTSNLRIEANDVHNFSTLARATRLTGPLSVRGNTHAGPTNAAAGVLVARECPQVDTDLRISQVSPLDTSLAGLSGVSAARTPVSPGNPAALSLHALAVEYGAVVEFDSRYGVALSGTDVTGWTDRVNGVVWGPAHAGQYPVYTASDANFLNKPSIEVSAPTTNLHRGFAATLSAGLVPTAPWFPTVVLVFRMKTTAVLGANASRLQVTPSDSLAQVIFPLCEGFAGWNAAYYVGATGATHLTQGTPRPNGGVADTSPHWLLVSERAGGASSHNLLGSTEKWSERDCPMAVMQNDARAAFTGGLTVDLQLFKNNGGASPTNTVTASVVYAAVYNRPATRAFIDRLGDLIRLEFGVESFA